MLSDETKQSLRDWIENDGFDYTFRFGIDVSGFGDKKLTRLVNKYLEALEDIADYLGLADESY